MNHIVPLVPLVLLLLAADGSAAKPEAVAVVATLSGTASAGRGPEKRDLKRFDWLPEGSLVDVAPGASVVLALCDGQRFQLLAGALARISAAGVTAERGEVRPLARVPALPRLVAVDPAEGSRAAAVRVRGVRIRHLEPDGITALHDHAVLRFEPPPGLGPFRISVEDEEGAVVFRGEAAAGETAIPADVLKPGASYFWSVRGAGTGGSAPRGQAQFKTLDAEAHAQRAKLRAGLAASRDAGELGLLAEVDRKLGLLLEARAGFREALQLAPRDPAIEAALAMIERDLAGPGASE